MMESLMKPALLVLAAGMGSRYGGLKQIEAMGPHGETLFDYAVFDALRAGFGKIVFVIRRDIEADFRSSVSRRYENHVDVRYVHQELDMVPPGFSVPQDRRKPWGTAHATMLAAAAINEPFAVINADDFYGRSPFEIIAGYLGKLADSPNAGGHIQRYANVGYVLRDTLSDHGTVVRGICQCDANDMLQGIVETAGIERDGDGARVTDDAGGVRELSGDEIVSMNFWGFTPSAFAHFEERFARFLELQGGDPAAEFFLPTAVDDLIIDGLAEVRMLRGGGPWFGVTYPEDAHIVKQSIQGLVDQAEYPSPLWADSQGDD
jgi:hypothetical protein